MSWRHLVGPLAALLTALPLATGLADGNSGAVVRVGNHDGYSRVAFNLPAPTDYQISQQGQRVIVHFAAADLKIGPANALPHNVLGITGGTGEAEIVVAPGTTVRDWRYGNLVVIDVLDPGVTTINQGPAKALPATQPSATEARPEASTPKAPATSPPEAAPSTDKPAPSSQTAPAPAVVPANKTPPGPPAATPANKTPPGPPAAAQTGAATQPEKAMPRPPAAAPSLSTAQPAKTTTASPTLPPEAGAPAPPASASSAPAREPPPPQPSPSQPPPERPKPAPETPTPQAPAAPAALAPPASAPAPSGPANATVQPAPKAEAELVVPAGPNVGLAAFRRPSAVLIVFDQPLNIDLASVRDDPVFGTATVRPLQAATMVRVELDAGLSLSLSRTRSAWRISAVGREPTLQAIREAPGDDQLVLPAAAPGSVVDLTDPDTGATLLVGTQRQEGQGVPVPHRAPEFVLLASWQGVAVESIADTVTLRTTPQPPGFVLDGVHALSPRSDLLELLRNPAGLIRQFDFPNKPTPTLLTRLQGQMVDAATAPPRARGPRREALARTMIALGLGAEASAVLGVAETDDPRLSQSAEAAGLASIAALLAHRPDEAGGLSDPRLPAADDIAWWQAVRQVELRDGAAAPAAVFAATLPLVLDYPPEIRDRLLPEVAETLVAGGELAAAAALLDQRKGDGALDLARAMLAEAEGDTARALAIYDRLAQSPDQLIHARAAIRAVELRLASGAINDRQAAAGLESLLYAWRGDWRERALRERLAALEARVGEWRQALTLMRESEALFPDDQAAIHAELTDLFATMLREDAVNSLGPLDLIAVVEENTDLLPTGPDGEALQAKLADRLAALDLPKQAGSVLEKLMGGANTPAARAGFGERLAALRLHDGDAAGALAALDASAQPDLPEALVERRTLLLAQAYARRGETDHALAALGPLTSPTADQTRATILERANDWPAAQRALTDYAAKTVPAEGNLDDAQRQTLLRLATAAARAGDAGALGTLREREGARMGTGPLADMFRLLTADPVRSVADLPRSGQETGLARQLPSDLKAVQPHSPPTP
jgi:hypothetical protein